MKIGFDTGEEELSRFWCAALGRCKKKQKTNYLINNLCLSNYFSAENTIINSVVNMMCGVPKTFPGVAKVLNMLRNLTQTV